MLRKLTTLGKLRKTRDELKAEIEKVAARDKMIEELKSSLEKHKREFSVQLNEARRRTLRLGQNGTGGDLNFLPEYIESVESHGVPHGLSSASAFCGAATSSVTVKIHGRIVYYPPAPLQVG
jgi:hypothetical protein